MAALTLPEGIGFTAFSPSLLHFGSELTGALGGPSQWVDRLGDRYAMSVSFPAMRMEPKGRELVATLKMARRAGLLIPVPEDGMVEQFQGSIFVDGDGQTGTSLALRSLEPGYVFPMGKFFNLIHDSRRYLHSVAAETVADADGFCVLPLIEALRVIPSHGDEIAVRYPMLEGYPQGEATSWDVPLEPNLAPLTITVKESR